MDRLIQVRVNGNHLAKDSKRAGAQYEANATKLRITFDESWNSCAKTVTWWNAKGNNPVKIVLTTALLEDAAASTLVYLCPIPGEAMEEAGWCTFVIDGYIEGIRTRSVGDELEVEFAPYGEEAREPADPTPSQAEQLQAGIDAIHETIQQAVESAEIAQEAAIRAEKVNIQLDAVEMSAQLAKGYADDAYNYMLQAKEIAGGDFTTETEVENMISGHNSNEATHQDIRNAVKNAQETAEQAAKVGYTKAETLTDATRTLFGLGAEAVPDDVLALIQVLITENTALANSRAKIAYGSYVGTDSEEDSDDSWSINVGFKPVAMWMYQPGSYYYVMLPECSGFGEVESGFTKKYTAAFTETGVRCASNATYGPFGNHGANRAGNTYYWFAIG